MKLGVSRQVVKAALNPTDKDAGVIDERIDGVLECTAEERLADVQQVKADVGLDPRSVSYTHLDVYKRQELCGRMEWL